MICRSLAILSFAIAVTQFSASATAADRPNVLWIIAEDFSPHLGCYGTAEARTPHIDALAAKGLRFTNAFATAPVCSASRSAFMTGMYQTTIGAHNHRSHRDDSYELPEGVRVLPHWLRDAGVFTANIVHLSDDRNERFYRGTGKTDWNFNIDGKPFESNEWSDLKSHQPFYAQINFSETHRGPAWNNADQHIEQPADPAKVKVPPYYPNHPLVRDDWAQYLNSAMALDKKVGRVLDQLERDGLADNTVVFFFSDHGQAMPRGKQWCYDSGLHVPLIVHVPATVKKGDASFHVGEPGSTDERLVEAIDFAATTLALLNIAKPDAMQGHDLFSREEQQHWRDAAFGARDRCDETVFRIRTVRTPRYRYIRNFDHEKPFLLLNRYKETSYPTVPLMRSLFAQGKLDEVQARLASPEPRPQEELYDLENDPDEIQNLASSSEHAAVLEDLRTRLDRWIEETNDQGQTPEPASRIRQQISSSDENHATKLQKVTQQYPQAYPLDRRFLNETWLEEQETSIFDPTSDYDVRVVDGWTLRINQRYAEEPQLLEDVLAEASRQFKGIENTVPAPAVEKLKQIEIWVEVNNPMFPCMCYHANERWLRAHGVNPEKTGHVELANGRNFLSWTKHQPWMMLHELAHGYHDRFIADGYENASISKGLKRSKAAGLYGEVDHIGGKKRDHYAATNPMEYFAESSESYFGKNDFYPFDRKDLESYDIETLRLIEGLWGVHEKSSEEKPRTTPTTQKE